MLSIQTRSAGRSQERRGRASGDASGGKVGGERRDKATLTCPTRDSLETCAIGFVDVQGITTAARHSRAKMLFM